MRLLPSVRGSTGEEPTVAPTADADGRGTGLLRRLLVAAAVVGLAYAASRRLSTGETAPSADEVRGRASDAIPDRLTEAPAGMVPGDESAGGADAAGGESPASPAATGMPGEERSEEEIAERAEDSIQQEPAEPGEMNVDEEVVEDIVDEAIDKDERELAEEAVDERVDPAERSSDDTEETE